jgi:spore maturation protein B
MTLLSFFSILSHLLIPAMLLIIVAYGWAKGVPVFDTFIEGAKEGLIVAFKIIPTLIALLVAVTMFKDSGALDLLTFGLSPIGNLLNIPTEVLPMALLRPISGSGALAMLEEILHQFGPDGFIGRCASVMMGSTETTFYTIAVYFGAVGIQKTGYTLYAALFADFCSFLASVFFVTLILGVT